MPRRTILLIGAVALAALGTLLVWLYATRAQTAALAGQEPVQVLVATADIPAGTSGAAILQGGSAELRTLPRVAVPEDALSDVTPVADQVVATRVLSGQVLQQAMFGSQADTGGGLALPEGTLAVSISLGDPQRVAGFVTPGSEVAVFVSGTDLDGKDETQTALLLPRVPVVAVGPSTSAGSDGQSASALLTLALTQAQAQRVIQGQSTGQLYLGLLDADSRTDDDMAGTTGGSLLD